MSLNSVSSNEFYGKINSRYNQNQKSKAPLSGDAYLPFGKNTETAYGNLGGKFKADGQEQADSSSASVQMDYRYGRVASELLLQNTGRINMSALVECGVRYISYEESDFSRVYMEAGYSLKAQVDITGHKVYIEQKCEDGSYRAYEVNPLQVADDTENPVEQMAKDAWEAAREIFNDGTFTEISEGGEKETTLSAFDKMLSDFSAFVEKRIKDGPPKIQIGGAAFSEKEWERLLRKIDKDIDAYKEELRERIRKQQEAAALKKTADAGSAAQEVETMNETMAEASGVEIAGHVTQGTGITGNKSEGAVISENEALEGLTNQPQRGSSFLARLSKTKKAPYSYLADESGMIVYKGVTFVCDDKKQQICLGDMSDSKNVINIPLSKGGCLRVNRDNIADLAKAIDMFSPEDVGRILRAISQDSKLKGMEQEIENMESTLI